MLFSAYRREDFADPEGFVAQLGLVLTEFSDEVVIYVTSPRTGLQRRLKWPPTISEVIEACEEHRDFLLRSGASQTGGEDAAFWTDVVATWNNLGVWSRWAGPPPESPSCRCPQAYRQQLKGFERAAE